MGERIYTLVQRHGRATAWRETFSAPDHKTAILRAVDAVSGGAFELWCAGRLVCRHGDARPEPAGEACSVH